jgi:murein L,D-transpeptidase YcbB/YkuD
MLKMKTLIAILFLLTSLYFPVQAMTPQSVDFLQQYDSELQDLNAVSILYKNNNSLWLNKQQLTNQAYDALDFIASAPRHGLNAEHYHLSKLRQIDPSDNIEAAQHFDVLLTNSLLVFIHDLAVGRLEANVADPEWFIPQAKFDAVAFLQQALLSPHLKTQLNTLIPTSSEYSTLTQALARYQGFVDQGDWPIIPEVSLLRPGEQNKNIPIIRARLAIEDMQFRDIATENLEQYDQLTEQAVRRFQKNHGLKIDGVIGSETHTELNVSAQDRVQQIKATLERKRWMPADLGSRYVQVNLASYTLTAVENNTEKLAMRVIVGKKYRQTPSFVSQITQLVVNPYWTVPYKLAVLDLLPKQQADIDYFHLNEIRVFANVNGQRVEYDPYLIDWQSLSKKNFPYTLKQEPGAHNALGAVKFLFPNPWSIYLHDSPHKELFNETKRNLSSGCIRVEDPLGFANFSLDDSKAHQKLLDIIHSKENKGMKLAEPLSIYVVYFTVSIDGDEVLFSTDSYQRDKNIIKELKIPKLL